jgi:type IV secretory pathway VirB6-like protein
MNNDTTAYIVDTHKFKVQRKYPDASYAAFAMSDNYEWYPDNRYRMFHDRDELYNYWDLCGYESGKFYEGLGYSFDTKVDMFNDWLEE